MSITEEQLKDATNFAYAYKSAFEILQYRGWRI